MKRFWACILTAVMLISACPTAFASGSDVKITYPGYTFKAVTFSFDDGNIAAAADKKLIALFNSYGVKGTFNLYPYRWRDLDEDGLDEAIALYSGHEVANHSYSHFKTSPSEVNGDVVPGEIVASDYAWTEQEAINQVAFGSRILNDWFGYVPRGFVYPGGYPENHRNAMKQYMRDNGICYARPVAVSNNFDLPADWLGWKNTCKSENMGNYIEEFKALSPDSMKVFAIWGHSADLNTYGTWDKLEEILSMIRDSNGGIWNPTNIELYDYVKASEQVEITSRSVKNNSDETIYLLVDGEECSLAPGEQRDLNGNDPIPSEPDEDGHNMGVPADWNDGMSLLFSDDLSVISNGAYTYTDSDAAPHAQGNTVYADSDKWSRFTNNANGTVIRVSENDNYFLKFMSNVNKAGNTIFSAKTLSSSDRYLLIGFRVRTKGLNSYMRISNSANGNTDATRVFAPYISGGKAYLNKAAADSGIDGIAVSDNDWAECLLVLDYTGNKYSAIVNGECLGTAQLFASADTASTKYLYFYSDAPVMDTYSEWDDFEIYSAASVPQLKCIAEADGITKVKLSFNTFFDAFSADDFSLSDSAEEPVAISTVERTGKFEYTLTCEQPMKFLEKYGLTVDAEDIFGRTCAKIMFTTGAPEVKLISSWDTQSSVKCSVTVENETDAAIEGILAAVCYNADGSMAGYALSNFSEEAAATSSEPYVLTVSNLPSGVSASTLTKTVYAFTDIDTVEPIVSEKNSSLSFSSEIDYSSDKLVLSCSGATQQTKAGVLLRIKPNQASEYEIAYIGEIKSGESLSIPLSSGEYSLIANSAAMENFSASGFYKTSADLTVALERLNAENTDAAEVGSVIADFELDRIFDSEIYNILGDKKDEACGDAVVLRNQKSGKVFAEISEFYAAIEEAALCRVFTSSATNEKLAELCLKFGNKLGLDTKKAYEYFKAMDTTVKGEACKFMKTKLSKTGADVSKNGVALAFSEGTVLSAVHNASKQLEITGILKDNATDIQLNLDGYSSKEDSVNAAVFGKEYSDVKSLQKAITEAINAPSGGDGGGGGGGGSAGGGKVNSYNGGLTTGPLTSGNTVAPNTSSFSDLSGYDWAKDAILALKSKGVVDGNGDGKFEPERNILREEFVKMVLTAFDVKSSGGTVEFLDVDNGAWYKSYISAAASAGIIKGDGGVFGIGENITRQDLCVMIARILGKDSAYSDAIAFADSSQISDYAYTAVGYLVELGVISGFPDGTFRPYDAATRAEAAKILYLAMEGNK